MSPTENKKRSPTLKAATLIILVFSAGVAAGIVADRLVLFRQGRILPKQGMEVVTSRVVRQMDRELDLSEAQEIAIREILERREREIERLWSELRPRTRNQVRLAEKEIRQELNPDQIDGFEELRKSWISRARFLTGSEE